MTDVSVGTVADLGSQSSRVHLFNMAKGRRPKRSGTSETTRNGDDSVLGEESDPQEVDPLLSLRSRQEEEPSCKDILKAGLQQLYNFTIASCKYSLFETCLSRGNSDDSFLGIEDNDISEVEKIKRQLRFHFMNPFEKWRFAPRRRFPCKLLTQVAVIILCTVQLWIVATMKHKLNGFIHDNLYTFSQYFVMTPDCIDDAAQDYYNSDPVSILYTNDDLWAQLNYTALKYFSIKNDSVGPYGYGWLNDSSEDEFSKAPSLHLCVVYYPVGVINPEIKYYNYSGDLTTECFNITSPTERDIRDQLSGSDLFSTNISSVKTFYYNFELSSVYLKHRPEPLCCWFNITLLLENMALSGNMPVYIQMTLETEDCSNSSTILDNFDQENGGIVYNVLLVRILEVIVILASIISTYQCIRSLINSARFSKRIREFFRKEYRYKLRLSEYLPLYNLWFVLVTVSNFLVIIGTILEGLVFYQVLHDDASYNDVASIVFGMGVFLQWCGMLRFLSYLDKYNMLLITLRVAMPNVLRFMVCAAILYCAFGLLGWLVLGSYHPKFRDLSVTSECLFSLINGDDMFNTFVMMNRLPVPAFIFSKVYLYTFISLFIYVVISVFISLISDTYETLHEFWTVRSKGLLRDFANDTLGRTTHKRTHTPCSQNTDAGYEILAERSGNEINSFISNGGPLLHQTTSPFSVQAEDEDSVLPGHKVPRPDTIEPGHGVPTVRVAGTQ